MCFDDGMNVVFIILDFSCWRWEIDDIEIKIKFVFVKFYVFDNKDIYLMENKSSKKVG